MNATQALGLPMARTLDLVFVDQQKHARDLFVAMHGHEPEKLPRLCDVIAEACFELRKGRKGVAA